MAREARSTWNENGRLRRRSLACCVSLMLRYQFANRPHSASGAMFHCRCYLQRSRVGLKLSYASQSKNVFSSSGKLDFCLFLPSIPFYGTVISRSLPLVTSGFHANRPPSARPAPASSVLTCNSITFLYSARSTEITGPKADPGASERRQIPAQFPVLKLVPRNQIG